MHTLILGMTESGKTSLAKIMCSGSTNRKRKCAVLDPLYSKWNADFQTADNNEFLRFIQRKENLQQNLYVDESAMTVGRNNPDMNWLATTSRHFGHSCHFIVNGNSGVAPIVRSQCSMLYLFALPMTVIKVIADEWNKPELVVAPPLQQFEFYKISKFGIFCKGKVDRERGKVYLCV